MKKVIQLLIVALASIFIFASCKPEVPQPKVTITYETEYGTCPAAKSVLLGHYLTNDDLPELTAENPNFYHYGWYIGEERITTGYKVEEDITLTAKWNVANWNVYWPFSVKRENITAITTQCEAYTDSYSEHFNIYFNSKDLYDAYLVNGTELIISSNSDVFEAPEDCSYLFSGFSKVKRINFKSIDTSNTTNMKGMFYNCPALTSLDLYDFDTSKVTDMSYMFYYCKSLSYLYIKNLITTNVTNMAYMFYYCSKLYSIEITNFDATNVTDMSYLFYYCYNLATYPVITNTKNVKNMSYMFYSNNALKTLTLQSSFSTENVTNMTYMFYNCNTLKTLNNASANFDTTKVTDMSYMFYGCNRLETIQNTKFKTENVTDMSYMFYNCNYLKALDTSAYNTSNVTNMAGMFYGCTTLFSLNLLSFDTSKVTDMSDMFYECYFIDIFDLTSFDTSNVTKMDRMFSDCYSLTTIYVSDKFDTSAVTSSEEMFYECTELIGAVGFTEDMIDVTAANTATGYFSVKE